MVIDAAGRFVRADDDGNVLYVMLNQEAAGFSIEGMRTMTTHGLTFLLDVPTVAHGDRVFNQIVDLAKRFADVLKGAIVDDNRRPLSDGALEPIRRQIVQYQSSMAAQKLPAGSRLAKRLFS
jgi:FtsZ-interacting cell division protein ZipA